MHKPTRCAALAALSTIAALAGCATTTTPDYDTRFGDAVRQARSAMTINRDAPARPDPVAGMDGQAALHAIERYKGSFETPPPVVDVINIGGGAAR